MSGEAALWTALCLLFSFVNTQIKKKIDDEEQAFLPSVIEGSSISKCLWSDLQEKKLKGKSTHFKH